MDEEKKVKVESSATSCCESSHSDCCDASNNYNSITHKNQVSTSTIKEGEISPQKLKVDIYVPLETCSCTWVQFMNLMFTALTPYIKYIRHETRSLNSEEARKLNLKGNCVIVEGKKKYTTSHALKQDLPALLKEKGLI
ncbi:MAG: hypothetical protein ACFFBP_04765 [Promethearchaeota archaeon]